MSQSEEFEGIYSDQDVKTITTGFLLQLEDQRKLVMNLTNQNELLQNENNELKKQLASQKKINSKNILAVARVLEEKSKLIESNLLLQEVASCKNMNQLLDFIQWRSDEQKDLTIVQLKRDLDAIQKKESSEDEQNLIKNKNNKGNNNNNNNRKGQSELKTELVELELKNSQDMLENLQKQMKEKEFFLEIAFSYLGTLENSRNRSTQVKEYIEFIISQLKSIISDNRLNISITLS